MLQRQAEQHDVKRVTAVWLEIGALSCVEETPSVLVLKLSATERWRKVRYYISSINPPKAWCWDCSQVVRFMARCAVSGICHGERRVDTGDSLIVKSM
ncbi:hydrogenase/urease maturation nickel metallochaperone HypA [Escherichia coli]